jgi:hypothetical protein
MSQQFSHDDYVKIAEALIKFSAFYGFMSTLECRLFKEVTLAQDRLAHLFALNAEQLATAIEAENPTLDQLQLALKREQLIQELWPANVPHPAPIPPLRRHIVKDKGAPTLIGQEETLFHNLTGAEVQVSNPVNPHVFTTFAVSFFRAPSVKYEEPPTLRAAVCNIAHEHNLEVTVARGKTVEVIGLQTGLSHIIVTEEVARALTILGYNGKVFSPRYPKSGCLVADSLQYWHVPKVTSPPPPPSSSPSPSAVN